MTIIRSKRPEWTLSIDAPFGRERSAFLSFLAMGATI